MNSFLIAISGPTAAGKSYFTKQLEKTIQTAGMTSLKISTDEFYKDLSHMGMEERIKINYDLPNSIDIKEFHEAVIQLTEDKPVDLPVYDFSTHTRTSNIRRVEPAHLIIVEGIFSLSFPEINKLYDLKIYIELDQDLRLIRRVRRDLKHRGRDLESVFTQYLNQVRPAQDEFVTQDREKADIILLGNKSHHKILETIRLVVEQKSKGASNDT